MLAALEAARDANESARARGAVEMDLLDQVVILVLNVLD